MPRETTRTARRRSDTPEITEDDRREARHDRADEEHDDAEREARRARRSEGARDATSTTIGRGRAGIRKHREEHVSGDFPDRATFEDDEPVMVLFLDDDFIVTYYQHEYFDEFKGEKRQKTFVCLGDDCPLCDILGDNPRFYALINIVTLTGKGAKQKAELKLWYATPNPGEMIEAAMDKLEEREQVINDGTRYYEVLRVKNKNGFRSYSMEGVKSRDLEEDYGLEPLTDAEIEDFKSKLWTEDVVRINKRSELLAVAEEIQDED